MTLTDLDLMSGHPLPYAERVNPDTVTVIKGPSFGAGPVLRVIHRDGPTWTAMPARGSRWKVINQDRVEVGTIAVQKIPHQQRWGMAVAEISYNVPSFFKAHTKCMYPVYQRDDGSFEELRCDSRDKAIQSALACLYVGQDRAGVYPIVDVRS